MDKFMHFVEDKMSPIADKLGEQRHLSAMQKGFMTVLPLIFVGAVFMVIANPPVTADMVKSGGVWSIFSGWFNFATKYKMAILVPYNMSMGLLALAVTFVIADNLATSYSMKGITNGLTALVVFLLVAAPANYLALADGTTPLLISGTYPVFLSLFVYCLDWRVFIFIALMIPLTLAIWYPFFVAYDHSLCKKEEAAKLAEEEA